MGKAAKKRKTFQKGFLVELSHRNPADFMIQWDMRLESWLKDVRHLATQWRNGKDGNHLVFEVLDNALEILRDCEPAVTALVLKKTYTELSYECSVAVASVVDGRFCHLSSTYNVIQLGRKK